MAYGNWGAFVYRNGERAREHEDATPYKEKEYAPGYHQAFGIARVEVVDGQPVAVKKPEADLRVYHATLGAGRVRLCGYKAYPTLFVDGAQVELTPFGREPDEYGDPREYAGTVEGHEFTASLRMNFVDLYLKEPDGTTWTATCGYEYGAGHMDVD